MNRRLRQQVSYANVMSTIAVFLALGGGVTAIALPGTRAVKKDDLATKSVTRRALGSNVATGAKVKESTLGIVPNANALDGLNSTAFLRGICPAGTQYFAGVCFETANRGPAMWTPASDDCEDEQRWLASVGDLLGFRHQPGITLDSPNGEWTAVRGFDDTLGGSYADIVADTFNPGFTPINSNRKYRCVAAPTG